LTFNLLVPGLDPGTLFAAAREDRRFKPDEKKMKATDVRLR